MATSFDVVEDLALTTVRDYKLGKIYNQSEEGFKKYVDSFLIAAIPNFLGCRQSLDYDKELRVFFSDLTPMEISILADLWVLKWFETETQDATKINVLLQTNNSFKTNSAAQNLKEKDSYIKSLYSSVYQKMQNDYPLQYLDELDF